MDMWEVSNTLAPFSHYTLKKYIENAHRDIYETKQLRLIIVNRANNTPIGSIELYDFDPFHQRAGIGIMVHNAEERKKGYATSAIDLLLYYAFETLGLQQIHCHIPTCNIASQKLFEKMGFCKNGEFKQWLKRGSDWEDIYFYQILHEDWKRG